MLQEPAFLILTAVAEEPRHGYAIISAVSELSQGRLSLRAGTLYAALDRFLEGGLIRVASEDVVEGRARRTYAVTDSGLSTLSEEVERLERNAAAGRRFLRGRTALGMDQPSALRRGLQLWNTLLIPATTQPEL